MGHLHLLSPLLLFSFIVVSSTATHLQFGRPPSSHLGSPLLFACSKFCTLVESTAASYISECNYYSPQGTCRSVYTGRNLLFFQKITRCFDLTLIHWHYHLIHHSQLKIDNTRALFVANPFL